MNEKLEYPNPINLDWLIENKLPVYVLNRSKPKGQVTITVFRPDKSTHLIVVKKTFIPVCITDQVNHATLAGSDDLRQSLSKQMLQLMDPREAIELMKNPRYMAEAKRLSLSRFADLPASAYSDQGNPDSEDTVADFMKELEQNDNITPVVLELVNREGESEEEKVLLLMSEDDLTESDFNYIIAQSEPGKLKDWAEGELAKL